MATVRRRRSRGKVDMLPAKLKSSVEQMLLSNKFSYREIVEYLAQNGHTMSKQAICNYAEKFLDNMQMMTIAQENFRIMMEELERYPDVDATEAIARLAGHHVFNTIAALPDERWKEMDPEDLLRQANGLIRATAYKKRVDLQNSTTQEVGYDAMKEVIFATMAKEDPELYDQVSAFLNKQKSADAEEVP